MLFDLAHHLRSAAGAFGLAARPGVPAVVLLEHLALFEVEERTEVVFHRMLHARRPGAPRVTLLFDNDLVTTRA